MKNIISTNNAAPAKNFISTNIMNMNKNSLEKLSKSQLIDVLLRLNEQLNILIQQNAAQTT